MNVKDLIADSHLAFLNQENETALNLAKQAIAMDKDNPDAYQCGGNLSAVGGTVQNHRMSQCRPGSCGSI